jgi:hypothetical protein
MVLPFLIGPSSASDTQEIYNFLSREGLPIRCQSPVTGQPHPEPAVYGGPKQIASRECLAAVRAEVLSRLWADHLDRFAGPHHPASLGMAMTECQSRSRTFECEGRRSGDGDKRSHSRGQGRAPSCP